LIAGKSRPTSVMMIAITTSISIKVKPRANFFSIVEIHRIDFDQRIKAKIDPESNPHLALRDGLPTLIPKTPASYVFLSLRERIKVKASRQHLQVTTGQLPTKRAAAEFA
jgi:hypothetical protein